MNITLSSKEELLLQLLLESKGQLIPFSHIENIFGVQIVS